MSAQTIFEQLRKAGCSSTGALALMGNWECESNLESCRVQGDFLVGRAKSKAYASQIDSGAVSIEQAAVDGKGWGLAQWTYHTRKADLFQFCKRRGVSIGDETAQVDFAISELQTRFRSVWEDMTTCGEEDLYKMTELICKRYEAPAYNNVQQRANAAVKLRDELQSKAVEQIDNGVEKFWPPRMICEGMNGPDVGAMQDILKARGYTLTGTGGVFGPSSTEALKKFQSDKNLAVDGVCGPISWAELLKL